MIYRLRLAALAGTAVLLGAVVGSQAQQPPPQFPNMTFFITSAGVPAGANFGGLDGADKHCQTLADYARAYEAKSKLARDLALWHQAYDLLLAPVTPTAAPPVGTLYNSDAFPRWTRGAPYTLPFNLTGQPAASMPAGLTASGLPVGLQIVGPPRADHRVLLAMQAYESASDWCWPQPKVLESLARLPTQL